MLAKGIRRVMFTQAVLTLIAAVGFWLLGSGWWSQAPSTGWSQGLSPQLINTLSAVYGGLIALLGTWWLGRRVQRASEVAHESPQGSQLSLYAGAVQRFVGTLVLLGIGLGVLKLAPLPLIAAFGLAQFGFFVNVGGVRPPG